MENGRLISPRIVNLEIILNLYCIQKGLNLYFNNALKKKSIIF